MAGVSRRFWPAEDPKPVALRRVVAAVAGVGEDALDLGAPACARHRGCREGRWQGELAALRALQRGGDGDFAEFVGGVRLPFADSLDLMGAQAVDVAAALTLPLFESGRGLVERPLEDCVQLRMDGDLALDVADDTPEIGLQFARGFCRPS